MKKSSIYNKITNEARKSDCSFGASGGFTQDIRVGWGKDDSHTLAKIQVTEECDNSRLNGRVFCLYINGELIRRAYHHKKGHLDVDWVL